MYPKPKQLVHFHLTYGLCLHAKVMMRMSPSGSKRHRVKRMSTFSGQPISGMLDPDGELPVLPSLTNHKQITAEHGQHNCCLENKP